MGLFNAREVLLSQATNINTNQTGTGQAVVASDRDDVPASSQNFKAVFEVVVSGGTAPTWDAVVETSHDGANWITVASATQRTGAGTFAEIKDISTLLSRVRARVTVGGTAAPNWNGKVTLVSDGIFKLVA